MRIFLFATIAVAAGLVGIDPAAAQRRGTIVDSGPYPLPEVRINRPGMRPVVGHQMPMRDRVESRFDTRDYRRDPIRGHRDGHDGYGYDDDYAYEDDYDHDDRRRGVSYGDARDIDYDRDYPYDHPYGAEGYGFGGYTMTETITTTTTPTIVKQIEYVDRPVAVHRAARYKTTRRAQPSGRRSIKGPRR